MPKSPKSDNIPDSHAYDDIAIVEVIWTDAEEYGDPGWNELSDMLRYCKEPCPIMSSVGFLLMSDNTQIAIASTLGPGLSGRVEKIPRGWIVRETIIRPGVSLTERQGTSRRKRKGTSKER